MNPDDVRAHFTVGRAYLQSDRPDRAIEHLERVLALQEDYTSAYVLLGEAYEKAGRLARAIKTWTRGIEVAQAKGDLFPRNQMQEHLARVTG